MNAGGPLRGGATPGRARDFWLWTFVGILGLLLALYLAFPRLDADQAITGLIGVYVLHGAFPTFFWMQDHAGVPESYIAAPLFFLFGISRRVLDLVPALSTLALSVAVYRTGALLFGRVPGLLGILFTTVVSAYVAANYTLARAYYVEHLLVGQIVLLGAVLWLTQPLSEPARCRVAIAMGLAGGVGLYFNFQIVDALVPAVLALDRSSPPAPSTPSAILDRMDRRKLRHMGRLARIFWAYRRGAATVPQLPVRLWIESTSRCNLKCGYCPNKDVVKEDHGFMDFGLYTSIIDQVADHAYDVNLFHRGEPLMHPRLADMVAYARDKGLYTRVHTNITLLNEKKGRALIESGLDFLSCSFDGYEKDMYEKNRVGAKFEWALDHLKGFLRLKRDLHAKHPLTVLQVMEIGAPPKPELKRLRRAFLDTFKGLPLDRVVLRTPHNWAGDVFVPELSREALLADGRRFTPCTFLWYSTSVYWDGTVVACPQDFFGKLGMGDLKQKPLREIWNDSRLVDLRAKMAKGDIPKELPCYTCDRIWRHQVMQVPTDYLKTFLTDHLMSYGWLRRLARV